jgi:hypothetical protein
MCPIPNGFRDRVISLYSSKIVDKKEILRIVSNTGIYCSSDKSNVIHFRKFHRQHQCTLQLVWGHGVLLVWVRLDVPLYGRQLLDASVRRIGQHRQQSLTDADWLDLITWPLVLRHNCHPPHYVSMLGVVTAVSCGAHRIRVSGH